jgi:hypothetical protein
VGELIVFALSDPIDATRSGIASPGDCSDSTVTVSKG